MYPSIRKRRAITPDRVFPSYSSDLISHLTSAGAKGLFQGTNGNASLRYPAPWEQWLLMTASGTAKGRVRACDLSLLDLRTERVVGPPISSEAGLHRRLYAMPNCACVLHTHPTHLLALFSCAPAFCLDELPLYEAKRLPRIVRVPACEPGSPELAEHIDIGDFPEARGVLWLERHGLCVFGPNLPWVLNLTEELEHLAQIALWRTRLLGLQKP